MRCFRACRPRRPTKRKGWEYRRHTTAALAAQGIAAECLVSLDFDSIQDVLRRADIVFCHGGTGSIITALREGCRVIAMPRSDARAEAFDDHQLEIVNSFAARGLLDAAQEAEEVHAALVRASARVPVRATTEPEALRRYLNSIIAAMTATPRLSRTMDKHHERSMDHQRQQREA